MAYLVGGHPARSLTDYYPSWLDNLAGDVTIEGSAMDGAAQGAEAVRTILVAIRSLYERQEFNFVGPVGDNGLVEDYTAQVRGEPISCIVLVTATPPGRRSTLWRTTGHAARCCSCPAWWARSSPAPPWPSTSPQAETDSAVSGRIRVARH
jgi:hypothetical protein